MYKLPDQLLHGRYKPNQIKVDLISFNINIGCVTDTFVYFSGHKLGDFEGCYSVGSGALYFQSNKR